MIKPGPLPERVMFARDGGGGGWSLPFKIHARVVVLIDNENVIVPEAGGVTRSGIVNPPPNVSEWSLVPVQGWKVQLSTPLLVGLDGMHTLHVIPTLALALAFAWTKTPAPVCSTSTEWVAGKTSVRSTLF